MDEYESKSEIIVRSVITGVAILTFWLAVATGPVMGMAVGATLLHLIAP